MNPDLAITLIFGSVIGIMFPRLGFLALFLIALVYLLTTGIFTIDSHHAMIMWPKQ